MSGKEESTRVIEGSGRVYRVVEGSGRVKEGFERVYTGQKGFWKGLDGSRGMGYPQKALRGSIPDPYLEPSTRTWSHFVGIFRQN